MANTTTNMGLTLNVVGITQDPIWSNNINGDWSIIDAHDHSVGKGAQVTPAGLNINSDLSFNFNNVTSVRSWGMQNQSAALALSTDLNCGYFVNGNFYINNNSGTPVQITSGSGLNFSSLGTIGGDFGEDDVPAAVTYSKITKNFAFTQDSNIPASLSVSSVAFGYPSASPQFVTVGAPTGVSAYTITLPAAAVSASIMTFDTSGNASFTPYTTANTPSTIVARDSSGNINAVGLTVTTLTAASSTIALVGNETISGTLGVTGSATAGSLASSSTLVVNNNATVGGNLAVSGAATIAGTASLGSAIVSGNLGVSGTSTFSNPIVPNGGIAVNAGSAINLKYSQFNGSFGVGGSATLTVGGTVVGINGVYTPSGSGNSYFLWPTNIQSNVQVVGAYSPTSNTVFLQNFLTRQSASYYLIVTYY